jgi:hypothetical protein
MPVAAGYGSKSAAAVQAGVSGILPGHDEDHPSAAQRGSFMAFPPALAYNKRRVARLKRFHPARATNSTGKPP